MTVELLVGRCPGESLGKAYIGWSLVKHSEGKIEYFNHYSLTGRPSQVTDNWRFRSLIRTYLKAFVTL